MLGHKTFRAGISCKQLGVLNELVAPEVANLAAKPLQLSQLQQQIQDSQQELEQQEQERQLAEYLAFSQQLQNHSSHQLSLEKNNFKEIILNNDLAMILETQKESLENAVNSKLFKGNAQRRTNFSEFSLRQLSLQEDLCSFQRVSREELLHREPLQAQL